MGNWSIEGRWVIIYDCKCDSYRLHPSGKDWSHPLCSCIPTCFSACREKKNDTDGKAVAYLLWFIGVRDLVCPSVIVRLPDLECFWDPEYHAAAKVVLMTTSTGTRSATALFEALIVRRIPFPAYTNNCMLFKSWHKQLCTQSASASITIFWILTAMNIPLGPLKLSIQPF